MSPAMQSARGGMQALKAGYDHARSEGAGMLGAALRSVGTSTLDIGREAGRSVAESVGVAPPTASRMETVGGRAAETRRGMTAQVAEASAAGGASGDKEARNVSPPNPSSGSTVTQGGGSTPAAPAAQGMQASQAVASGMQAAQSGSSLGVGGELGKAAQSDASAATATNESASNAGTPSASVTPPGGVSSESPTAMRSAVSGIPETKPNQDVFAPQEKRPLSDLHQVRPPQIPDDSAPQSGVNIRLGHSEE